MNWEDTATSQKKRFRWSVKDFNRQQWLVLLLLGLLLVVVALPTESGLGEAASSSSFPKTEEVGRELISTDLERQLSGLLHQMEGVGQVEVMLYTEEESGNFTSMSMGEEVRGTIRGALIVAEGADNPVTIRNIQEAVMALFQVEAHKIKVVKMK